MSLSPVKKLNIKSPALTNMKRYRILAVFSGERVTKIKLNWEKERQKFPSFAGFWYPAKKRLYFISVSGAFFRDIVTPYPQLEYTVKNGKFKKILTLQRRTIELFICNSKICVRSFTTFHFRVTNWDFCGLYRCCFAKEEWRLQKTQYFVRSSLFVAQYYFSV